MKKDYFVEPKSKFPKLTLKVFEFLFENPLVFAVGQDMEHKQKFTVYGINGKRPNVKDFGNYRKTLGLKIDILSAAYLDDPFKKMHPSFDNLDLLNEKQYEVPPENNQTEKVVYSASKRSAMLTNPRIAPGQAAGRLGAQGTVSVLVTKNSDPTKKPFFITTGHSVHIAGTSIVSGSDIVGTVADSYVGLVDAALVEVTVDPKPEVIQLNALPTSKPHPKRNHDVCLASGMYNSIVVTGKIDRNLIVQEQAFKNMILHGVMAKTYFHVLTGSGPTASNGDSGSGVFDLPSLATTTPIYGIAQSATTILDSGGNYVNAVICAPMYQLAWLYEVDLMPA